MSTLANKRVVVGVSGSIAAYKSAELIRRLREAGAEVRVVMTRGATAFITPLTLQALSGHPVQLDLLDAASESAMGHIDLARWADAVLIAPATADCLARLASGRADDLLSAVCLTTRAPIACAPAMNNAMWSNAFTQSNAQRLQSAGIRLFGPGSGPQACGETGEGRLREPEALVADVAGLFETGLLSGRHVMVTAGPTWEALDPVRGLSNRSSGKMGYAVAHAAVEAGARVTLISGPTRLPDPPRVRTVRVTSARDMHDAVQAGIADVDIFIATAAVADYRPAAPSATKLKRTRETLQIELVKNPDILASVAQRRPAPFTVGFAAETNEVEANAQDKLAAKGVDLIAANRVGEGCGFDTDENALLLIDARGREALPLLHKAHLARILIQRIAEKFNAKNSAQDSRPAHRH